MRSRSAFDTFYICPNCEADAGRRKRAQLGPMQAQVATAHKTPHCAHAVGASVARTVYHLLKFKTPYQDIGAKAYDQHVKDCEVAHLRKKRRNSAMP